MREKYKENEKQLKKFAKDVCTIFNRRQIMSKTPDRE